MQYLTNVNDGQRNSSEGISPRISNLAGSPLIAELCQQLDQQQISYCHWKSNDMIARSASGKNDLDLLIKRSDVTRFESLLMTLEFRPAEAPLTQSVPGIVDFYGYDQLPQRLIHVHAHYKLVVGDDRTKNHHVPLEDLFLESTIRKIGFTLPDPSVELVLFVFRMALKHLSWEALIEGKGRLSPAERAELSYLKNQSGEVDAIERLREHRPFLLEPFLDCHRALDPDCSYWYRIRATGRLRKALSSHSRRSTVSEVLLKACRRVLQAYQRRFGGNVSKRRLRSGGAIVAFVGGDGSGKTTAVDSLHDWLKRDLDTRKIHMGKPPRSRTTKLVRGVQKLGRKFGFGSYVSSTEVLHGDELGVSLKSPDLGLILREFCTSRDRYLLYRKARRWSNAGSIVISDRFPLPQLATDGPQLGRWLTADSTALVKMLSQWESSYYQKMVSPELLFVLRLSPEIAVKRKIDEASHYVRRRSQEICNMNLDKLKHITIDAEQSADKVAQVAREAFWKLLA